MLALHKLQDRVRIYAGREKEKPTERVDISTHAVDHTDVVRAKYIEGLENRLGRMESLLKMSGLLTEEEAGRTDLGTLEKRLADKTTANGQTRGESPRASRSGGSSAVNATDSQQNTPTLDDHSSPADTEDTPNTDDAKKREDVENLSDMMCSLVTNNVGETRYIGTPSTQVS